MPDPETELRLTPFAQCRFGWSWLGRDLQVRGLGIPDQATICCGVLAGSSVSNCASMRGSIRNPLRRGLSTPCSPAPGTRFTAYCGWPVPLSPGPMCRERREHRHRRTGLTRPDRLGRQLCPDRPRRRDRRVRAAIAGDKAREALSVRVRSRREFLSLPRQGRVCERHEALRLGWRHPVRRQDQQWYATQFAPRRGPRSSRRWRRFRYAADRPSFRPDRAGAVGSAASRQAQSRA